MGSYKPTCTISDNTGCRITMKNSGIYQIMNKKNYHVYIGSAVDIKKRWNGHKIALRKGIHHSILLQRAWDKYSEESFEFSEIEFVEKENLISKEQYYFDLLKPEYNICKIAGSTLGVKASEEAKQKNRLAHLGKRPSLETLAKLSFARKSINNPMYGRTGELSHLFGKHLSEETKQKIRVTKLGEKNPMYGKHFSEEVKQKRSIKFSDGRNKGENNPMSKTNRAKRELQNGAAL